MNDEGDRQQQQPTTSAPPPQQLDEDDSPPHHARSRTKTVTLYANGNAHFLGKPVVVNRRRTKTWDAFLAQATDATGLVFAARDVLTPTNGTRLNALDQLVDGASYVVISKGNFKPLGYRAYAFTVSR